MDLKNKFRDFIEEGRKFAREHVDLKREVLTIANPADGRALLSLYTGHYPLLREPTLHELISFSLITKIPNHADLNCPCTLTAKGIIFYGPKPVNGGRPYYYAKFKPELDETVKSILLSTLVDADEEMVDSEDFFLNTLLLKIKNRRFNSKLSLSKTKAALYEAKSGRDINAESGFDIGDFFGKLLHEEELFKDAEAVLFHFLGVYVLKDKNIYYVSSNDAYEAFFETDNADLKKAKRDHLKTNLARRDHGGELQADIARRIKEAIKEVFTAEPGKSAMEILFANFESQTGLKIEWETIQWSILNNHENLKKFVDCLNKISFCLKKYPLQISLTHELYKFKDDIEKCPTPYMVKRFLDQLNDVNYLKSLRTTKDNKIEVSKHYSFSDIAIAALNAKDERKQSAGENLIFQDVLSKIFDNLSATNPEEISKFKEILPSQWLTEVKAHANLDEWSELRWIFITSGIAYLKAVSQNEQPRLQPAIIEYFEAVLGKPTIALEERM